jgi:hypothetical protein
MPDTYPIVFTPAEARRLLAQVRPAVAEMVQAYRRLQELAPMLEALADKTGGNGGSRLAAETVRWMQLMQESLTTIRSEGILVKDLSLGLLDFPSLRQGRVVFLCWMHGEDEIAFWHEEDAGLPGRQPIE